MVELTVEKRLIEAGSDIELVNKARDAQQVLIEGVSGASLTNGIIKLNCFEQFSAQDQEGKILGKYNVILNIPLPMLSQISAILHRLAEELIDVPSAEKSE